MAVPIAAAMSGASPGGRVRGAGEGGAPAARPRGRAPGGGGGGAWGFREAAPGGGASAGEGWGGGGRAAPPPARLGGRAPEDVTLVAVSKTHGPEAIRPLIEAGQRDYGENRVQEAQDKGPARKAGARDVRLPLIGRLQSNKAADAVTLFDSIHSVDRPSLVAALAEAMAKLGRRPGCFLQVNIGDEPQKGGCPVADLPALLDAARAADLPVIGLMCLPPADVEPAPYFALLAKLARRHDVTALSMGMSGDYETAVTIGATHVRVGTALFGERH